MIIHQHIQTNHFTEIPWPKRCSTAHSQALCTSALRNNSIQLNHSCSPADISTTSGGDTDDRFSVGMTLPVQGSRVLSFV